MSPFTPQIYPFVLSPIFIHLHILDRSKTHSPKKNPLLISPIYHPPQNKIENKGKREKQQKKKKKKKKKLFEDDRQNDPAKFTLASVVNRLTIMVGQAFVLMDYLVT